MLSPASVRRVLSVVALMAVLALPTSSSPPPPVVIDFENLTTGGLGGGSGLLAVFHQYEDKGISFNDPLAVDYSKAVNAWAYQGFAHSGTKAIEPCAGKEFCSTPLVMTFAAPQNRVKVWVGYSGNLSKPRTVILSAYDSANAQVGQATATFNEIGGPIPIRTPLEVKSSSHNIASAKVSFAPDAYGGVDNGGLAIDDVEYDEPGHPIACPSTTKPVVALAQPTPGQILRSNAFNLQGTVTTTSPLEAATMVVTGADGSRSVDLLSTGVIPHSGGAFSAYGYTDLLYQGSNTITVKAQDCYASGENSTRVLLQPCDAASAPVVSIAEPGSPGSKTISSDSFTLKGNIASPSALQTVNVTITAGLPYPGSHQFVIYPDSKGAFDVKLSSDNLFRGNNTITVTAQNGGGCAGEASTTVVFEKMLLRRIAGNSYLEFAQEDPQDHYKANAGFLYVTHNPGCGVSGNNGDDKFFTPQHDLPFWATLDHVEFEQFWPKQRQSSSCGIGYWFGAGSYLTNMKFLNFPNYKLAKDPRVTIHWENACCGDYSGKNIEYVASFIVKVPEGLVNAGQSLGEPMFDPNLTPLSLVQPPSGFDLYQPPPLPTPQPSGPGKLMITLTFDAIGTQASTVTASAQGTIVTKTGTAGDTTFKATTTQQVNAPGIAKVNFSADNLIPGTWSVSVTSNVTGIVGGYTCEAYVPGAVDFNWSGGTGLKCTTFH